MATSSPSARNRKADLESLGSEKTQNKGWKRGLLQKLVLEIQGTSWFFAFFSALALAQYFLPHFCDYF